MTNPYPNTCDDALLDRYLEEGLDDGEKARMETHLQACPHCRGQVAALTAFSRRFCDRVQQAAAAVDFVNLEKQVLVELLHQRHARSGLATFWASLKYAIPIAVTAGLLIFFAYSTYMVKPAPAPSAIINSFTGAVSSVMIFETPETRQTILWYKEAADSERQPDAD